MNESSVKQLLEDLKSPSQIVRQRATEELWRIWYQQKGVYGWGLLQRSQILLTIGEIAQAKALLTELIEDQPDFSEAWNRRAVLCLGKFAQVGRAAHATFRYYTIGHYKEALDDCQTVINLNPIHFGALHGLGLCHIALGNYSAAIQAFRQALEIQPYTLENQKLILECTAQLS